MILDMFRDGEWVMGILFLILYVFLAVLIIGFGLFIVDEMIWAMTDSFPHPAKLLRISHVGSTLQSTPITTVSGDGHIGVGIVTTGHSEEHITIWDCGIYGRLTIDDETIFRWAEQKSTLLLKKRGDRVRISGIEHK